MTKKTTIFVLCSIICVIMGCSYPLYESRKMDYIDFKDKRGNNTENNVTEFIRPEDTEDIVRKICKSSINEKEYSEVIEILKFVQCLKYRRDSSEFWQYPAETLKKGGDCEDKTFLLLSMLIKAGMEDAQGVKGKHFGKGHMWVEYDGYILDPLREESQLIPIGKSIGYTPYFKFNLKNCYFCDRERMKK